MSEDKVFGTIFAVFIGLLIGVIVLAIWVKDTDVEWYKENKVVCVTEKPNGFIVDRTSTCYQATDIASPSAEINVMFSSSMSGEE